MNDLKLTIAMVPPALWRQNLRTLLPANAWKRLRETHFLREPICWYCGAEPTGAARHAHEDWDYDQKASVARLIGLHTICQLCHFVKHPGMTAKLVALGHLPVEIFAELERHFCQVNGCSSEAYRRHCEEVLARFGALQQVATWRVDLAEFSTLASRTKRVGRPN